MESGERRARADALLADALDRPESEREAFLTEACSDDTELFAPRDRAAPRRRAPRRVPAPRPGSRGTLCGSGRPPSSTVRRSRRERSSARGRSSTSWAPAGWPRSSSSGASSGTSSRLAALKLIKRGVDTDEVVHRFRQERQILASLEHPEHRPALDGGVSADGRPFFVMERIDGSPIDERCDQDGASIDARLRRFLDVCRAVEHAHRKLVVHRDLKPSNILIDARRTGEAARFRDREAARSAAGIRRRPRDAHRGQGHDARNTPAPSRCAASRRRPRGDVYQLGLILYELLTGQRAQDLRDASLTEIERVDLRADAPSSEHGGEPHDPRLPASPELPRLRRRLRGDLDNIVLKALRKEPDARYPSVTALIDDLERHLDGRPVAARRPTLGYRLGRFARRHKVAVAAAVLVAIFRDRRAGVHVLAGADRRDRAGQRTPRGGHGPQRQRVPDRHVRGRRPERGAGKLGHRAGAAGQRHASSRAACGRARRPGHDEGRHRAGLSQPRAVRAVPPAVDRSARDPSQPLTGGPDAQVAESLDHLGQVLQEQGALRRSGKAASRRARDAARAVRRLPRAGGGFPAQPLAARADQGRSRRAPRR